MVAAFARTPAAGCTNVILRPPTILWSRFVAGAGTFVLGPAYSSLMGGSGIDLPIRGIAGTTYIIGASACGNYYRHLLTLTVWASARTVALLPCYNAPMPKPHIGKLKPMHSLLLNPHPELRLTRCPHCEKLTYPRKFAFFIHVDGFGPYTQGKMCKYCARCKMILVQQDELEDELSTAMQMHCPSALGNKYFIIGVVELKTFKTGIAGAPGTLAETLEHVSDLREQFGLSYIPGGWYHESHKPRPLPGHRPQLVSRTGATSTLP